GRRLTGQTAHIPREIRSCWSRRAIGHYYFRASLNDKKRQQQLQTWLEDRLQARFAGRILGVDLDVALEWGILQGEAQKQGAPVPVIDSLIAATAVRHNLTLVTRNVRDFERFPIRVLNPWNGG